MAKAVIRKGNIYSYGDDDFSVSPTLDDGIYQTQQDPMTGVIFLEKISEGFSFGFKLYGLDEVLIKHVIETYNKQENKHNIGVLLNGAKGTGKTVTAKVLANKLGLPVIICDKPYGGLSQFLAGINHDCVFFFDEFEKNFRLKCNDDENCAGEDLLSIMDGVYNNNHCHVFILTTNELKVNDNLISRPSRIRYLKSFGDVIDKKVRDEFIDDNLRYPQYKDEIIEFFEGLTIGTIDILKSIIDEVNLHNCSVNEFKGFFNVKPSEYRYSIRTWIFSPNEVGLVKKEDFIAASRAGYSIDEEYRPNYDSLLVKRCIRNIKEGDKLNHAMRVKEVDMDNNYLLCENETRKGKFCHYYIENPDAAPNLYNTSYTYGYDDGGLFW